MPRTNNLSLNSSTTTTGNSTTRPFEEEENKILLNSLIIFFYSLIVVISLCGNSLVCKVAFGKAKMRTTTNMLIASLACSDILMTAFNIPFNVARLLLDNWPFGDLLCFLVPFVQVSCVYVSTFTMTVIALHRWWTITKRVTSRSSSLLKVCLLVIAIWCLASSFSLPHSMFNQVKHVQIHNRTMIRCRVTYPIIGFLPDHFNYRLFLTIEVFLTQYLTPLVITCIVYIKIAIVVCAQGQMVATLSDERRRHQADAKRRRIVMLALVVCVFALCWMPLNVYYLLVDSKLIKHNFKLFITCHWFAMSSVCYNPFIYCWLNESFRKGAKKFFRLVFGWCYSRPPCCGLSNCFKSHHRKYLNTNTTTTITTGTTATTATTCFNDPQTVIEVHDNECNHQKQHHHIITNASSSSSSSSSSTSSQNATKKSTNNNPSNSVVCESV